MATTLRELSDHPSYIQFCTELLQFTCKVCAKRRWKCGSITFVTSNIFGLRAVDRLHRVVDSDTGDKLQTTCIDAKFEYLGTYKT